MPDSLMDKLGIYDVIVVFFSGSIISICSLLFWEELGFPLLSFEMNDISTIFMFVIISSFLGTIFQEFSSIIYKTKIFPNSKLLDEAFKSEDNSYEHMSQEELIKLVRNFGKSQHVDSSNVNNVIDIIGKTYIYNKCKYYLIETGNTTIADKNLALSSMARSLAVYFGIIFIVAMGRVILTIKELDLLLLVIAYLSLFLCLLMHERFKRFAIIRYVYIMRTYAYKNN